MDFSVTEIQEYLTCPRRWTFGSANHGNLTRAITKPAFQLGLAVHKALEEWVLDPALDPCAKYLEVMGQEIEDIEAVYKTRTGSSPSPDELNKLYDTARLGAFMMENYQNFWKTPLPDKFVLVAPEQEIAVEVPHCDHRLKLRIDALIRNTENDQLYILDHKTYEQRPHPDAIRYSFQFRGYTWGVRQLNFGNVAGVAYDGLWKREKPPKGKSIDDLFTRTLIKPSTHELNEFGTMLPLVLDRMANETRETAQLVANRTSQCHWACVFNELCTSMSRGEDWKFIRNVHYTQRKDTGVNKEDE